MAATGAPCRARPVRPARRWRRRRNRGPGSPGCSRTVRRLAFFFDRAEQLGHRAVEAVGKPRAVELRPRDAVGRRELDLLMILIGSGAGDRALAADDEHAVEPAELRVAVEDERRLGRSDIRSSLAPAAAGAIVCVAAAGRRGVDSRRLRRRPSASSGSRTSEWRSRRGSGGGIVSNAVPLTQLWSQCTSQWTPSTSPNSPPRTASRM